MVGCSVFEKILTKKSVTIHTKSNQRMKLAVEVSHPYLLRHTGVKGPALVHFDHALPKFEKLGSTGGHEKT